MRGTKGQPYEGGHRVPLFIRFPDSYGVAPAEYADLVNYNDVLPTLVELAGGKVTVDYKMDGVSLLPLVTTGQQPNLDERILITDTQRGELAIKGKQRCVMQGNWRLVKKNELYNLATDPGQKENVFEDHPRIAAQLDSAYDAWWTEILPDIEKMNRIVVGAPEAEEVLLTCHDWHTEGRIPWHQGFIREALVDKGWWALDVREAGEYQVGLYRYPPEARLAINEVAAAVPAVPNGKVQPEGVPLAPAKLSISFGDKRIERPVDLGKDFQTLTIHLPAGDVDLTTVMSGLPQEIGSAAERGFYYVSLSPVRK